MPQFSEPSDQELIRLFCLEKSPFQEAVFEVSYDRFDADVKSAISFHNRCEPDDTEVREIADELWVELWQHPSWIQNHNCSESSLKKYLKLLAVRQAETHRRRQESEHEVPTKSLGGLDDIPAPGDEQELDPEWLELARAKLGEANFAFLLGTFDLDRAMTDAERQQRYRLIQELRHEWHLV